MNFRQPQSGEKCCANCKWSRFDPSCKTPKGRWRAIAGKCDYEIVWPPMPLTVIKELPQKYGGGWRMAAWPNDGGDCPVFEEAKPG
jgi:hypothetical protein